MHSRSLLRSGILEFRAAHVQRDELEAEKLLRNFPCIRNDAWWDKTTLLELDPVDWFVDAVAFLMWAVMPRRDEIDRTETFNIQQSNWEPSASARQFADTSESGLGGSPYAIDATGRYASEKTTMNRRHVPVRAGDKFGDRDTLLEELRIRVTERLKQSTVPRDIEQAFLVALDQAQADSKVTDQYDWLPSFNLGIRGWIRPSNQSHVGTTPSGPATNYNGPAPQQYMGNVPQAPNQGGQPPSNAMQGLSLGGASAPAGQPDRTRYHTIGEVGNHQTRTDLWALVDDGSQGFDIYDVTGEF